MFPSGSSVTRRPPWLLAGSRGSVSLLSGATMKTLRLPLSVSTASLRSAIDTSSCLARSLTPAAKSLSGVPGVVVHASVLPCSGRFRKGDRRLSQVSREPFRTFALLSDPGRTIALGFWRSGAAPAGIKAKAPAISQYFEAPSHGFCTRCIRLRPPSLTTLQCSLPGGCHLSRADSVVPLGSCKEFPLLVIPSFPSFLDLS